MCIRTHTHSHAEPTPIAYPDSQSNLKEREGGGVAIDMAWSVCGVCWGVGWL